MYEINVALNGRHYFATAPRSLTTSKAASNMLIDFVKRFPASEGFNISVSYDPGRSYGLNDITIADIDKIEDAVSKLGSKNN